MNKHSVSTLKINNRGVAITLYLAWLMLFSACRVQNNTNSADISPTPMQEVELAQSSGVAAPTQQTTREPTATHPALATKPAMVTVTKSLASSTPTATITPLPTPTFNAEELRQKWHEIDAQIATAMASNNECLLPCWWGIEPGDSVTDTRQIFNSINESGWVNSPSQRGKLQRVGFFEHDYRNKEGDYLSSYFVINLVTETDQVVVTHIILYPHTNSQPSLSQNEQVNERLLRDWEQYSAQSMFEMFGNPTQIHLLPRNFADGDSFLYEFNIYYPEFGIVASYDFPLLNSVNGKGTMCLNMRDMDSMDLYLYNPANKLPESYLQVAYTLWPLATELEPESIPLIEFSDLESRVGMSINEFVTLILNDESDTNCFNVN